MMSDEKKNEWLDEEGPVAEQELQQAQQLGAQVDALFRGEEPRQVSQALSTAVMIRAAFGEASLNPSRRDQLIEEALVQRSGHRLRRWAPALALAASVLIGLSVILQLSPGRAPHGRSVPLQLTSRGSDALIGRPFTDRAGASQRLDLVFADRLGGYRKVLLGSREAL